MKELTLQEVFNYKDGSKFKMCFKDNFGKEIELKNDELFCHDEDITEWYTLKALVCAKFYLVEQWKEIDYYMAYTTSSSNIKYINGDEEIIGTHYGILSKLDTRCRKTGEDLTRLLADAKWYVKVV